MADAPIISIVTPSYNQGEFLEETLVSVLSQEGDFFLDYLVIDGGSTDRSPQIIQTYAERIEKKEWPVRCRGIRYRWVSEKDRGQTDAIMKGFHLAEGDVFAWLNSDDVYLPGALQSASTFFQAHPTMAFLYGDAYFCNESGVALGRYPVEDFDLTKLAYFNFICQPSTFFRRNAFEEVGGLDSTLHYGMDYDLFIKICKQFHCFYLPRFFSKFRLHDSSKTMRNDVLYDNHQEALSLALKHFSWAPVNLVYGTCHYYCLSKLPSILTKFRLPVLGATLFCTVIRYLQLNKGLRREDLKLLTFANFLKIFKTREEILQG